MCGCERVRACVLVHVCLYECVCIRVRVNVHVCMCQGVYYVCESVCVCVCESVCVYACVHVLHQVFNIVVQPV